MDFLNCFKYRNYLLRQHGVGVTSAGQRVVQVKHDPRLVAGEARDGGGARDLPTVDQIGRGLVLRVAEARAHLVGQAGGARVERACRSRARSGGRSSDGAGFGATVHGRRSWWCLRAPGVDRMRNGI